MIYDCNLVHGCAIYHEPYGKLVPTETIDLDAELDLSVFMHSRRFQLVRSLLDLLGFIPEGVRPVNCVQVTAQAVGIRTRCRTPRDLMEVLWLCPTHSNPQKFPSSPIRVRRRPSRKARSGGKRFVARGKHFRLALAHLGQFNYKPRHSAASS